MIYFERKKSLFYKRRDLNLKVDGKSYDLKNGDKISLNLESGKHNFMITIKRYMQAYSFSLNDTLDHTITIEVGFALNAKSKSLELKKF